MKKASHKEAFCAIGFDNYVTDDNFSILTAASDVENLSKTGRIV